jgi:carbonic anhydrase/acetyltransferase-like protein (isoleucine patch superfamily)
MTDERDLPFDGITPTIAEDAWIAPGAAVIGAVTLGARSSIWFNVTARGDVAPIRIGEESNVQDNAVLHVDGGRACIIGNRVTIGHGAIVHACTVEDEVLIGMGAIVLSRAHIGTGSIIAAGAVVPEDAVIEPHTLVMGVPGKPRRTIGPEEHERIVDNARRYVTLSRKYLLEENA